MWSTAVSQFNLDWLVLSCSPSRQELMECSSPPVNRLKTYWTPPLSTVPSFSWLQTLSKKQNTCKQYGKVPSLLTPWRPSDEDTRWTSWPCNVKHLDAFHILGTEEIRLTTAGLLEINKGDAHFQTISPSNCAWWPRPRCCSLSARCLRDDGVPDPAHVLARRCARQLHWNYGICQPYQMPPNTWRTKSYLFITIWFKLFFLPLLLYDGILQQSSHNY